MFVLGLVLSFAGLLVLAAIRPGATGTYFDDLRPPSDQTTMNIAHHVLLLPNQSMWVLVPAMGGCDGLSGGGVSATFLCYSKVPTTVSVTPGARSPTRRSSGPSSKSAIELPAVPPGARGVGGPGRPIRRQEARTDQGGGHRRGSRVRRRLRGPGALGSWLASVSAAISSPAGGIPANASVLIGPAVGTAGLLALAWGVLGGALGGGWGQGVPSQGTALKAPSSLHTRWAEETEPRS